MPIQVQISLTDPPADLAQPRDIGTFYFLALPSAGETITVAKHPIVTIITTYQVDYIQHFVESGSTGKATAWVTRN